MKQLYESILDIDNTQDKAEKDLSWMGNIVWSKSHMRNFIFMNIRNHVNFDIGNTAMTYVDDYIHVYPTCDKYISDDLGNKLSDCTMLYYMYCTHADNLNLNKDHIIDARHRYPIECTVESFRKHRTHRYVIFSVRIGDDKEASSYPYFGVPKKDAEWIIKAYKNSYDKSPTYISRINSNFDGSVKMKDILR